MKNKEEAESIIKDFKEQNKDATHNCYAYTCGTNINYGLFGNLEITQIILDKMMMENLLILLENQF